MDWFAGPDWFAAPEEFADPVGVVGDDGVADGVVPVDIDEPVGVADAVGAGELAWLAGAAAVDAADGMVLDEVAGAAAGDVLCIGVRGATVAGGVT